MSQNTLSKSRKTSQCLHKTEIKKEKQSLHLFVYLIIKFKINQKNCNTECLNRVLQDYLQEHF